MDIIKYNPELWDTVEALNHANDVRLHEVPALGFVVSDSATPVAAGFLRMVEGGFAQIDGIVTNPGLTSEMRHEGLSKLVGTLIETAKSMNIKGLYAHTQDEGIMRRAAELGFQYVPQAIIALPLC